MNSKPDFYYKPIQHRANKLKLVPHEFFQDGVELPHPLIRLALSKTNPLHPVMFNRKFHLHHISVPEAVPSFCITFHPKRPQI